MDLSEFVYAEGEDGTGRLISLLSPVTEASASEKTGRAVRRDSVIVKNF
jgi:hypothetical protein